MTTVRPWQRLGGRRSGRRKLRMDQALEAAATAAAEEQLMGGDLGFWQIRFLGKCLGVKDGDATLDVICKLARASARYGRWAGTMMPVDLSPSSGVQFPSPSTGWCGVAGRRGVA